MLFNRANSLRAECEFDKAAAVYEDIVAEFPNEAEGYWGLVLCRYGIEYVDDPETSRKIPTCHLTSFKSVLDDRDFASALKYSDERARALYKQEAETIDELRRGIIEVSGGEEPYDVFICYKDTDARGARTPDSVIAQDIYDALTEKGYRVFFARISLEDKLGREYEPYIFAALQSARIMLVVCTRAQHINAVWVKNEWSRYIALISSGQSKTLIPCYKDMAVSELPEELKRLQAQDMGKLGALQDLLRGVQKLLGANNTNYSSAMDKKRQLSELIYNEREADIKKLARNAKKYLLGVIISSIAIIISTITGVLLNNEPEYGNLASVFGIIMFAFALLLIIFISALSINKFKSGMIKKRRAKLALTLAAADNDKTM